MMNKLPWHLSDSASPQEGYYHEDFDFVASVPRSKLRAAIFQNGLNVS